MPNKLLMTMVLLTALGVGSASVVGALMGFLIKKNSARLNNLLLSFSAGVMLAAASFGLILPSLELGGSFSLAVTVIGIFCGAFCVSILDRLVPHLHKLAGVDAEKHPAGQDKLDKVLLFVIAIAIHNLPEGIAAGVGFGTENTAEAFVIAGGIALQNIPEGMVMIAPMLSAGIRHSRTLAIAVFTGLVEVFGTLIGYFAVSLSEAILPFALAFAGGTMIYVISDEMIPETHSGGDGRGVTYSLLAGFSLMLAFDVLLG